MAHIVNGLLVIKSIGPEGAEAELTIDSDAARAALLSAERLQNLQRLAAEWAEQIAYIKMSRARTLSADTAASTEVRVLERLLAEMCTCIGENSRDYISAAETRLRHTL